jgi:opacity protein-like surface antigen
MRAFVSGWKIAVSVMAVALVALGTAAPVGAQDSTGVYVIGSAAWQQREKAGESSTTYTTFDPGFAVNGAIGYQFGVVGIDGEFSYMKNKTKNVASTVTGEAEGMGEIALRSFMGNVRFSPAAGSPVRPYFGAGVGVYKSYLYDVTNVIANSFGFEANGTSDGMTFAYQFRAGVGFAVAEKSEVFVGYRYFKGSELLFIGTEFGDLRPDGAKTHSLEGGIKIGF